MTLTDATLNEIEARAKAATKGPWEAVVDRNTGVRFVAQVIESGTGGMEMKPLFLASEMAIPEDEVWLSHARSDIPALIAALRESRAALRAALPYVERFDLWSDTTTAKRVVTITRAALGEEDRRD